MATIEVLYWKDIPSQVRVRGEDGQAKAIMPERFQLAIDQAAMVEGSTDDDTYLAGWEWKTIEERDGDTQTLCDIVVEELTAEFPNDRLEQIIKSLRPTRKKNDNS